MVPAMPVQGLLRPSTAGDDVTAALDGGSPLTVLTAVAHPSLEAELVAGFANYDLGVTVVRRCVDVVELLAAAAVGTARAALVSADLRGLDGEALAHLGSCGLVTVGLAHDESGERLLHQLGADFVLAADSPPEQVAGALRAAAAAVPARGASSRPVVGHSWPRASPPIPREPEPGLGTVIVVWGPTGAPGRTTIAVGLADALATRGVSTLLIDADPYGGSVASLTGLLDESPGITAACRASNAGSLDVPRLAASCCVVAAGLRVLTGLSDASRWAELRPAALEAVLAMGRRIAAVTVVDAGFCLEDDDELSYDTMAPRRNAATLSCLRSADRVVAVGSADPVGLARLVRELPRLAASLGEPLEELGSSGRVLVVANRLRTGLLPGSPRRSVAEAVQRHAGVALFGAVPMDVPSADAAHGRGQLLSEAAPQSALFGAVRALANALCTPSGAPMGAADPMRSRRFRRRRPASSAVG
jgi:MinD-like ATPase involved in chromosome partitioning or flagellar assembly